MICNKCGKEIDDDSSFCNRCGTVIGTNGMEKNYDRVLGVNREMLIRIIMISLFVITIICAVVSIPEATKVLEQQNEQGKTFYTRIQMPFGSKDAKGHDYNEILDRLVNTGFKNIKLVKIEDVILGWFTKDGQVENVTLAGEPFEKGGIYDYDAEIIIEYHAFKPN